MPEVSTHPTSQALALFGHGKLPEAQAATVAAHLETCADCRSAVAGLPADSFLGKVRAARPGASSVPPGTSPACPGGAPSVLGKPTMPPAPPANVPPELAHHPKFRIVRELGRGGMGVIYLAEHRVLEKLVALKVISPAVLDNPDALARFHAEVRAAGKLDHPNIARAHDADQAGDLHFLVMEYVEGLSLAQVVERKGPLPLAHACHYARQAALGLQHAADKDMVHRDIKPQNLMLAPKSVVKVLDFGLARLRSERPGAAGLTQKDSFMGTPEYVAPEQATDARSADTRADIYSLGCTLYALLTGRPPFQEDTMVKLVLAHIEKEPQPLHELRPDVPAELSAVVARMLAKDPARRYQRPVEVAQALVPFIKGGSKPAMSGAASVPPGAAAAGTGTRLPGDTSWVEGFGPGEAQLPAKAPAAKEEKKKESPFSDLGDAPAPVPAGKKGKKGHDRAKPGPAAWWKRPAVLAGAGAAVLTLAVLVLWASGVLRVKTTDGIIVLENLPPDAEVTVDGEKATVKLIDGNTFAISIAAGRKQRLQVKKDGFTTFGEEVEIDAGDRRTITVRLEPKGPAAGEFVSLFNGKDMAGWETLPDQPNTWRVEGGLLIGSGAKMSRLFTRRDDYRDFHLRLEVRLNDGLGGVGFRSGFEPVWPAEKPVWPECYAVGLNSTHPTNPHRTGSLYIGREASVDPKGQLVPVRTVRENPAPPHTWTLLEVIARGNRFVVKVNGETTADYTDSENLFPRGRIALNHWDPAAVREFRKIEIQELTPAKTAPTPQAPRAAPGSVRFALPADVDRPVYGEWEIKNKELVQPRWVWGARLLFGDKTWTDYDFTVEGQMTDRNCGFGLIFRDPGGELQTNKQDGTERHKDYCIFVVGAYANTHHELDQVVDAGGQMLEKTALEPAQRLKKGEWYTARVSVRGNRVRCYLNGDKLFDVFAKPPPAGLVGLMTWDAPFHFRNIKVTDPAGKVLLEGLPDLDK